MSQSNSDKQSLASFGGSTNAGNQGQIYRITQSVVQQNIKTSYNQGDPQLSLSSSARVRPNISPMHIDLDNFKGTSVLQSQLTTQQLQETPYTPPRKHLLVNNSTTSGGQNMTKIKGFTPTTAQTKIFGANNSGISQLIQNQQQQGSLLGSFYQKENHSPINSYNKALDSVAVLGNDFEQIIRQLENSSEDLRIERERNLLLSEQLEELKRESKNKEKIQSVGQTEVERLGIIIDGANQKLELSQQKNKTLERKIADYKGVDQKLAQLRESNGNYEAKIKQLEREAINQRELNDQKDIKIADFDIVRIENTNLAAQLQKLEKENANLKNLLAEKDILSEKQVSLIGNREEEINHLRQQLGEFEKQCEMVHDEIDQGIRQSSSYPQFTEQIYQSKEQFGSYFEDRSKSQFMRGDEQAKRSGPDDKIIEQILEDSQSGGRQASSQGRRLSDNSKGNQNNQNLTVPQDFIQVANPLQSSAESSRKNSVISQNPKDNQESEKRSSSSKRLEKIKDDDDDNDEKQSIKNIGNSQISHSRVSYELPADSHIPSFQKEQNNREPNPNQHHIFLSDQGQPLEQIGQSQNQVKTPQGSTRKEIGGDNVNKQWSQSGTLPPISKPISERISLAQSTPKQQSQEGQQNFRRSSPSNLNDQGASIRQPDINNQASKQLKNIAQTEISYRPNQQSESLRLGQQNQISNIINQRILNQSNLFSNLSVLLLSQSRNVRTVAVGENNMLNKVAFMRQQLQDKNQIIADLQYKIDSALQNIQELAEKNDSLVAESRQTQEELNRVNLELRSDYDQRKQEVDRLREDWQKSIIPLVEEKKRLEETNLALTEQCQAFDKAIQNEDEEKQKVIIELIEEKENLQNICEELQKQKEDSLLENLKIKESKKEQERDTNELLRINEDQQNQIVCQFKDIETWKMKYKSLKKEISGLKKAFDGYRQQILEEVSNSISEKSSNFKGAINAIRRKYQEQGDSVLSSARESFSLQQEIPRQFIQNEIPRQFTQQNPSLNYSQYQAGLMNYQDDYLNHSRISRPFSQQAQNLPQQQKDEQFLIDLKHRINTLKKIQSDQETLRSLQLIQSQQQQSELKRAQPVPQEEEEEHKDQENLKNFNEDEEVQSQKQQQEDLQKAQMLINEEELNLEELAILKQQYENALVRINSLSPQKRQ